MSDEKPRPPAVGEQVHLEYGGRPRVWWTIQAADERFAIATRQAPFEPKGEVEYTILDLVEGARGPCNLIGQGWDFEPDTLREDAEKLLRALNAEIEWQAFMKRDHAENGTTSWEHPGEVMVEISHRNRVPLGIIEIRQGGAK